MKDKPWLQVVQPHEDIRKGNFDESVFAADLGEVIKGRGAIDYRDPEVFFKRLAVKLHSTCNSCSFN